MERIRQLSLGLLFVLGICISLLAWPRTSGESICYGTPANGRLENGVQLASSGNNFQAYSYLGVLLQRTYVHHQVKAVVEQTYAKLYKINPQLRFKYGETGFAEGGRFKPHKTHRNGSSVDFMVPLRDARGRVALLPTYPWNKFGYAIDFNRQGQNQELQLDFEAMALHLKTLHETAIQQGMDIDVVIFDPRLQPLLFKSQNGPYLKSHLRFNQKQAWVRHDDHYHVNLRLHCRPL